MTRPNTLKVPAFQQQYEWIAKPLEFMHKAVLKYPDIFTSNVVGAKEPIIFVNHPQGIQEIFNNDRKKFISGDVKKNKTLAPIVGDYSVMLLDGDRHKRERQLLMPPFHGERMQSYGSIICSITERVFARLQENESFIARDLMAEVSLGVMLEAVFGLESGERYEQIRSGVIAMMDLFRSPLAFAFLLIPTLQKDIGSWSPWGNFLRRREQLDQLIYAEIDERRSQLAQSQLAGSNSESIPTRSDILSMLMSATDESGNSMTNKELRDELMSLLVAGYETTSTAMAWGLYWIYKEPHVREKLLQELDTLDGDANPVTISKLPYLSAICNETLRIHPVVAATFVRKAKEPVNVLGHQIEANSNFWGCIYLLHHREDLYPNSKQFRPERFLEKQFSPYEFMPFGGGDRRCIGYALALFEMKLALAIVTSKYELTLLDTEPEKPQRRGVTLAPSKGVRMKLEGTRTMQKSTFSFANA